MKTIDISKVLEEPKELVKQNYINMNNKLREEIDMILLKLEII
jgi:hypothetical protein